MAVKKEAVEIECAQCSARFRLWVPQAMLPEVEKGTKINCVKCGAPYVVRRNPTGFSIMPTKERAVAAAPVAQAAPVAPPPAPAEEVKPQAAATPKSKNRILFIDDDKLSREMIDHSFKDAGLDMFIVKNGKEAMDTLQKQSITMIVTDMHLKHESDVNATMDGEDILRKASAMGFKIPALMTTGKDIVDDLVEDPKWFDLNVKGFIQKGSPFWVEELKAKMQELLLD